MEDLQQAIMDIPKAAQNALGEWPLWIGFAALEYAGAMIQDISFKNIPIENSSLRNFVQATVRGGLFSMNLNYYNAAH